MFSAWLKNLTSSDCELRTTATTVEDSASFNSGTVKGHPGDVFLFIIYEVKCIAIDHER